MQIVEKLKKHINKDLPIRENVNYYQYILEQNFDIKNTLMFLETKLLETSTESFYVYTLGFVVKKNSLDWTVRIEFYYLPETELLICEEIIWSEDVDEFFTTIKKVIPFYYIEKSDMRPVDIQYVVVPM